jgi:hypothetical protein
MPPRVEHTKFEVGRPTEELKRRDDYRMVVTESQLPHAGVLLAFGVMPSTQSTPFFRTVIRFTPGVVA